MQEKGTKVSPGAPGGPSSAAPAAHLLVMSSVCICSTQLNICLLDMEALAHMLMRHATVLDVLGIQVSLAVGVVIHEALYLRATFTRAASDLCISGE